MSAASTDPGEVLRYWEKDPDREGELTHVHRQPARPARYEGLGLDPLLEIRLNQRGITGIYRHQAEAVKAVRAGQHVVLAAGTAAGKSLCFQIPLIESTLADPKTTSLLV
ncbi:MAG TPA: DEAD/DEAH box helicase, partial [Acidimicrobiia bacterium]|nr:DEAD/DEAH box helicase [Acidimicrobiia bacterium]